MNTDTNEMKFLRHILGHHPQMTIKQAFELANAASGIFAPPNDGVWFDGIFFTNEADSFMERDMRIAAIKAVRAHPLNGSLDLRRAKEVVDSRMQLMGYPAL